MVLRLLLDAGAVALPANTPPWLAVLASLVLSLISTAGLVLVARAQRKAPSATAQKDEVPQLKKDLATHGGALGELRARVEAVEDRGPTASAAQMRGALARISALETWRKERELREETRREQDARDDKELARILARLETKLEGLEQEDRDDRRRNSRS